MKIACDLDRTLAYYERGDFDKYGPLVVGAPIPAMVEQVKTWLKQGDEVVIFTARNEVGWDAIRDWTEKHIGTRLDVTNVKHWSFDRFVDDLAHHAIPNTGHIIDPDLYLKYRQYYLDMTDEAW